MKILLVRLSSLGDIFHAYSVPSFIKHHFPGAEISWLCDKRFARMLEAHPHVDHVFGLDVATLKQRKKRKKALISVLSKLILIRKERFDHVFDLQSNMKSGFLVGLIRGKQKVGFTFKTAREWPASLFVNKRIKRRFDYHKTEQLIDLVSKHLSQDLLKPKTPLLNLSDNEKKEVDSFKNRLNSQSHSVMVAIGASRETKKLSVSLWVEIMNYLHKLAPIDFFFVWGSLHEKEQVESIAKKSDANIYSLNKMSIPLWQAHIEQMDALLGLDSSALHLATTVGIPTFAFFGPTKADQLNPAGSSHQFYQGVCPYGTKFDDNERCPYQKVCLTGACLKEASLPDFKEKLGDWFHAQVAKKVFQDAHQ